MIRELRMYWAARPYIQQLKEIPKMRFSSRTQLILHALTILSALGLKISGLLPQNNKSTIILILVAGTVQSFLAKVGTLYNPDGTPAQTSWEPGPQSRTSLKLAPVAVLLMALAAPAIAQQPAAPTYLLAAGAGWNHYASPQASGWMTFGAQLAQSNTYSLTTIDMHSHSASMRTGIMRLLIEQGYFSLTALGDAGIITGNGNVGGAFSGGGSVIYDVSRWTRVPRTYLIGTVRVLKSSLADVQPVFSFGIGKAF